MNLDLPEDLAPSEHQYEVLVWHDSVHERLENLRLCFFRLSFTPSYDRERIFSTLRAVYADLGISSHIAYETLGEYDLLLRMWVPSSQEPEEVELRLWDALEDLRVWNIRHFRCRTVYHRAQGPPPVLDSQIDDDSIREVNEFNERQGSFQAVPRTAAIESLIGSRWVSSVATDRRGIRFFVTFDHPAGGGYNPRQREIAIKTIREKCEEVIELWNGAEGVTTPQISIYAGSGSMTDFLVMARAPHPRFHLFARQLVLGLRGTELGSLYAIRPYTHVMADRMFSMFSECREVGRAQSNGPLDPDAHENESLEYKATFAVNFRSVLAVDRWEKDPKREAAVVRAVCGLLNSPTGGRLLIGILETAIEAEHHEQEAFLSRMESLFDYRPEARRDKNPSGRLPNAVLGVEAEIGRGRPFESEEDYRQHLLAILRQRIEPLPIPWLRVDFVPLEGRTVCMISARLADVWFYMQDEKTKALDFYVREAASTRLYQGALMDSYKAAYPRGGYG